MENSIEIPERAAERLALQRASLQGMIDGIVAALDVPAGWLLSPDGRHFVPPNNGALGAAALQGRPTIGAEE